MPRRRRNMGSRLLAQRRAQQAEEWAEGKVWFSSSSRRVHGPEQQMLGCSWLLKKSFHFSSLGITCSLTVICLTFQFPYLLNRNCFLYFLRAIQVKFG